MMIDRTFLQVHPATAAWFQQREKCLACASIRGKLGREGNTEMRCAKAAASGHGVREGTLMYCIDARRPEGPCGPSAALFIKAKGVKS